MKLQTPGINTSNIEITQISLNGIWVLVNGEECFMSFDQFPWFRNATIAQIHNVELLHGTHLRWPDLDIDLHLDSLKNLVKYPLIYFK